MGLTTTLGGLIGAAIDGADGDDSVVDGAVIGAITANVLKVTVPLAIVAGAGYFAYRRLSGMFARPDGAAA